MKLPLDIIIHDYILKELRVKEIKKAILSIETNAYVSNIPLN